MLPKIRSNEELIVRRVGDELIIYDLNRDQGHALNPTASFVFEQCDGQTSIEQIASRLAVELNVPQAKQVTTLALERLSRANLLVEQTLTENTYGISRRDLLKLAGKAGLAAAMLPVVTTLLVPSAAHAQSGVVPPDDCQLCDDTLAACLAKPECNTGGEINACQDQCFAEDDICRALYGCPPSLLRS